MTKYRVKRGDTLWHIAQQHYGKGGMWPVISKANQLPKSHRILAGMTLLIPDIPGSKPTGAAPVLPAISTIPKTYRPGTTAFGPPPPPSPPARSTQTYTDPHSADDSVAMKPAVQVRYPAVKYTLEKDLHEITLYMPPFKATAKLTGSLSVQKQGTIPEIEFTFNVRTLEPPTSIEYKSATAAFLEPSIKFEPKEGRVWFSLGASKEFEGTTWELAVSVSNNSDSAGLRLELKESKVAAVWNGYLFEGSIGGELEFDVNWKQAMIAAVVVTGIVVIVVLAPEIEVGELIVVGGRVVIAGVRVVGTAAVEAGEYAISWVEAMGRYATAAATSGTATAW
jgi:LysM domain